MPQLLAELLGRKYKFERKLIPPSKDIGLAGFMRVLLVLGIAAGATWFPSVCMIRRDTTELWQLPSPLAWFPNPLPSGSWVFLHAVQRSEVLFYCWRERQRRRFQQDMYGMTSDTIQFHTFNDQENDVYVRYDSCDTFS